MRMLESADRCSGCTLLLEAVLAKAAGGALDDVARELLLEPLGITDFAWTKNFKSGILDWGGLRLCWRDLAKIGQLVLNGGNWNGRQIVSQKRVKDHGSTYWSCRPQIFLPISMVARAFPGRGARGAVDLCNGTRRAAMLYQRSTLWWWLRLDFTLTQFMGGCSLVAASTAISF
jgi:CubicO group peptidase (beta-lactamase class C family)